MLPATFDVMLPIVLQFDDMKDDRAQGEAFATSYGVTEMTWANGIGEGLVANKPLSDATRDDCIAIIRADYFNRCRIGALPAGGGLMVFNDAVLTGAGHAAALLNRIVGAASGTAVSTDTIRLAGSYAGGAKALIDAIYAADEIYLAALKNAPLYLKGWTRREDVMRAAAYRMIGAAAPAPIQNPVSSSKGAPSASAEPDPDNSADTLNAAQLAANQEKPA